MLEDRDVQKLIEVFITREEFNEAISNLVTTKEFRKAMSELHSAIDAYAKKVDTYAQEMLMLAHKIDRHEKWLHQIAEKLGIKLEY